MIIYKVLFSGKEDSMNKRNIPVGVSDFSEIRQNDYYYVDKSELIRELLKTSIAKVTHITPPFWQNTCHEYACKLF